MLVTMKEILDHANEHNYAVIAPNIMYEMEVRASIKAAEELNAPVILDVAFIDTEDIVTQGWYYRKLAEQARVPVALNLDHGANFAHCVAAIRAGYTSIMVDRSSLPYAENVAQVKELARIAHCVGVTVEAELGHVGQANDDTSDWTATFTKPEEAKSFVEETGIDCLAIAMGTAHGMYKGVPTLDFDLLATIKKELGIPLVLHGGSGSGDENIRKACSMGINKVNLCSEMLHGAFDAVADAHGKIIIYDLHATFQKGYVKRLKDYIELGGGVGKAWTKVNTTGLSNIQCTFNEENAIEQAL